MTEPHGNYVNTASSIHNLYNPHSKHKDIEFYSQSTRHTVDQLVRMLRGAATRVSHGDVAPAPKEPSEILLYQTLSRFPQDVINGLCTYDEQIVRDLEHAVSCVGLFPKNTPERLYRFRCYRDVVPSGDTAPTRYLAQLRSATQDHNNLEVDQVLSISDEGHRRTNLQDWDHASCLAKSIVRRPQDWRLCELPDTTDLDLEFTLCTILNAVEFRNSVGCESYVCMGALRLPRDEFRPDPAWSRSSYMPHDPHESP